MKKITILDSTLRDGAQGEGLTFSLRDKLEIARALDQFGVDYIEAGIPGSNPKDMEFFREAAKLRWHHARLCAFGGICHKGSSPARDVGIKALLKAETPVISLVGKASRRQAKAILNVTGAENCQVIGESVAYLAARREVIFDAEHFFDGAKEDFEYALSVLEKAWLSGATWIVLCDTNGGSTPTEIETMTRIVRERYPKMPLGFHGHNDSGCAVANSMLAVESGAFQVHGTFLGFGERCGNADLSVVIPNLMLKKGCTCQIRHLEKLCQTTAHLAEIANVAIPETTPYVGRSAFAHKGGMHTDGMLKLKGAFEHVLPESVGNHRRYLVSEMAGRSAFVEKVRRFAPQLTKEGAETARLVRKMKRLEQEGYQFEAADASFELMVRRELGTFHPHFELIQYKTIGEYPSPRKADQASAMIEVKVGDNTEISAALGDGPVHALDQALRKALCVFYPQLEGVHLVDYKVRVLDGESATAAKVRVLIDTRDGANVWTTVGVSTDIIEASWQALVDSIEYQLREP